MLMAAASSAWDLHPVISPNCRFCRGDRTCAERLSRYAHADRLRSAASMTKYTLGFWQGAALYVGAVIGTGILVLPAIAAETAGPASVLAWLALVLVSFPLALTYAGLSRDRPDAAGFAGAIERAFGPRGGAAAGWIFLAQA